MQLARIIRSSFILYLLIAVAVLATSVIVNPAAAQTTVLFDFEANPDEGNIEPQFTDPASGFVLSHTAGAVRGNTQWANNGFTCVPHNGDGCMRLSDLGVGATPTTATINFSESVDSFSLWAFTFAGTATITPIVEGGGMLAPIPLTNAYALYDIANNGPYIGLFLSSSQVNVLTWDDLQVTFGAPAVPRDSLLGAEGESGNLLTVDPQEGTGAVIGDTGIVPFTALSKDPISGILYGGGQLLNPPILYTYQTTVEFNDSLDGIDTAIIDWITPKNFGGVGEGDLTYLSIALLDGPIHVYTDIPIINGVPQPIGGAPRAITDIFWDFRHDSNKLFQLFNASIAALEASSGVQYSMSDGDDFNLDGGTTRLDRYQNGDETGVDLSLGTTQDTRLLRIENAPSLYEIEEATGAATQLGILGTDIISFNGADSDASGQLWASVTVDNVCEGECENEQFDALATIDKNDGSATIVGFGFGVDCIDGISFDSNGTLWGVSSCNDNLYQIDLEGGDAEFIVHLFVGEGGLIPADGFHSLQFACQVGGQETLFAGLGEDDGDGGVLYSINRGNGHASRVGESSATDGSSLGALAQHTTCGNSVSSSPTPVGEVVTVVSVQAFEQVAANVVQAGTTDASFCVVPDIRWVGNVFTARNLNLSELSGLGSCTGPVVPGGAETWEADIFPNLNLVIASWYRSYLGEFTLPGDATPTQGHWMGLGVIRSTAEFDGPVTYISFPEALIDFSNTPPGETPDCDRPLAFRALDIAGAVPAFGDFPNFERNRMIVETAQCNRPRSMTRRTTHIFPMRYVYPKAGARAELMNISAQIAGISGTLREAAFCADPALLANMQASLRTAYMAQRMGQFSNAIGAFEEIARAAKNAETFGTGFAGCPIGRNYRGNFMSRGVTAAFTSHDRFLHAGAFVKYFVPADLEIPLLDSE